MSIEIVGYDFEGPYLYTSSLSNRSGVYVILTPTSNSNYKVLDVGESAHVKTRVETHNRTTCWNRNANNGGIRYAAYYTGEAQRMSIERKIRDQYDPPCGKK